MYIKTIYVFIITSHTAMHDSWGICMSFSEEPPAVELPGHKGCSSSPRCHQVALHQNQLLVLLSAKSEPPAPTWPSKSTANCYFPDLLVIVIFTFWLLVRLYIFSCLLVFQDMSHVDCLSVSSVHYSIDCSLILRNWKSSLYILHTLILGLLCVCE